MHRIIRAGVLATCILLGAGPDQVRAAAAAEELAPIPHPLTMLLRDATAQRDLRLQPEQIKAVAAALDEVELPLWQLRDFPTEQRNEPAEKLLETLRNRLATILSTQQQTRLDQIVLQSRSIRGLVEPAVAEKLNLSIGQIERMREVIAGLTQGMASLQQGGVTASEAARARVLQGQAERNALAVLDRDQQRTLRILTGRAFDFSRVRQRACRAPELRGVETWINAGPVTLADLRGNVVIVHFYTFGCINCIRNLPHYVAWQEHFAGRPVRLVGIHRPETQGERVVEKVREKAAETGLTHPIAIDNDSHNWDAWANNVWPAVYLIDKQGFVRYWWYGELNWQGAQGQRQMRAKIEQLLREEG
ncbi:MAG: redoxin domain-containing protein [Phycisphaerales bacterium]|nr:MAG: redoxin domain-containing protein [Phycisphaerales bacterium]